MYSELYLKNNFKIPTIVATFLIFFLSVAFGRFFMDSPKYSRAAKKTISRLEIVNISPIEASVFWQTEKKDGSWVIYGESSGKEERIAYDSRQIRKNQDKFINHLAVLKDLKPGKKYYFRLISNNELIATSDGSSFNFTTPQNSSFGSAKSEPVYGLIKKPNLEPLTDAYVILSKEDFYPLLTQTKSDGSFLLSLSRLYDKQNRQISAINDIKKIKIEIIGEEFEKTTIFSTLENTSPLPQTIIIGKNYDFSRQDDVLSAVTGTQVKSPADIQIIYPKEKALIPGRRPIIKGIALPNSEVFITVNSEKTFSARLISDKKGQWSYYIPDNLALGEHTVTVRTKAITGKELVLQRKFTIIAQEGPEARVLGTASGEPTITQTLTPSPTQTVSPTLEPTVLPTQIVTAVLSSTPAPTLYQSGRSSSAVFYGALSLIILGGGILLVF